jgi:hypothetical protein
MSIISIITNNLWTYLTNSTNSTQDNGAFN